LQDAVGEFIDAIVIGFEGDIYKFYGLEKNIFEIA